MPHMDSTTAPEAGSAPFVRSTSVVTEPATLNWTAGSAACPMGSSLPHCHRRSTDVISSGGVT